MLSLQVSAQHSVASATQSTQSIVGDVGFRVDRRHLFTISGNLGVQVVELPSGAARPSGSILERNVPYALRFNHGTSGVGFTNSASSIIALTVVIPPCAGDVTGNGHVDGTDLANLLSSWSTPGLGEFVTDVNADGIVNGEDLAYVLGGWGPCP
jgi:hypothetical protein